MKYKFLVASDMDFTLLMPGKDCSSENLKAIQELRANGIAFTFATGRSSYMVGKYAKNLEIDIPIITSNGGALYDYSTKKHIYSNDFTPKLVREILEYCLTSEDFIDLTGYSTRGIYVRKNGKRNDFFANYNETADIEDRIPLFYLEPEILDLPDEELPDFSKFLVIDASDAFNKPLYDNPELEVCTSAPGFCDITPAGQTKGAALMKLADYMGILHENVFACGDNENDKSMLAACSYRIAMANATPGIKDLATFITKSCEEDGIAYAIRNYIIPHIS